MPLPSGSVNGNYKVIGWEIENAAFKVHFVNENPGGGMPSDWYASFALDELPANMNQTQLANAIRDRLLMQHSFGPLVTAINNGMTINIP